MPRHDQDITNQNSMMTSPKLKWCRDCQELAVDACQVNNHCTLTVSPTIWKFAREALAQGRQSQLNWEEAISKRNELRTIATSIQASVNRLKERVDLLVDENDRALLTLRDCFEDIKQSVNTLDPLCHNIDFKGFVVQSEHDLKIATEILETFSSFDGAHVSVILESNNEKLSRACGNCGILSGIIRWNDKAPLTEIKKESETNSIFQLDARRFIGFFVASVPHTPLPGSYSSIRRSKETRKLKKPSNSLPLISPSTSLNDPQFPSQALPTTPTKEVSELDYPPIDGNKKLCN